MPEVLKVVGRYEILREVGRGGMAMVYLARQTDLDRFVALKELGAFHASDPSFAQRFLRESRVAGSLSHPNIVTVHDYFEHDGTPYIAMEYIERGSLRPYVSRMTLAQIGGVLEGLLAGLAHAEQHGIVHRDLKPENLMVTADGRVKIADFGIAKATTRMQTGAFLTATGTTVGTPTYMAPEQAMAQDIGPWTDLYSVGCMAFELFTGNVPFHDSDAPMAILLRHVNEPIPAVKTLRPEVDPRISDWIERLLVKEPATRTQSAPDAWDDFEEILLGLLGPRWRREARLVERPEQALDAPKPLTPAPFEGTHTGDAASDEFKSFAWGAPASDTGPAAPPPMYTPPPSDSVPSLPEPVVGPPTPVPSQAVPAASDEPIAATGFVTFGTPAPPPPTDALITPPAEEAPPPVVEEPAAKAFETYIAPEPSRPPTSEPKLTPPPVEAAPPPPVEVAPEPEPVEPVAAAVPPPPVAAAPPPVDFADTMMPTKLASEEPAREQQRSGGRKWVVPASIAGGVAAVAVVAVVALGGGGDDGGGATAAASATPTSGPPVEASAAGATVTLPAGWATEDGDTDVPGFDGATVTVRGPSDERVVLGQADGSAANSTLLPDALRTGELPEAKPVDIADGAQALAYDGVSIGSESGTLFAVPTTAGVTTLACIAEADACASIGATLKVTEGTPFAVGPSEDYLKDAERILDRLEDREASAARDLRNAGRRTTQVSATSRLASAYTSAATSLSKLDVGPADSLLNANLSGALKTAGAAYKKAASEGRAKDRAGYKRQGSAALAAQSDAKDALDGFRAAGYELPEGADDVAKFTRLPTLKRDPKPKQPTSSSSAPATTTTTPQTTTPQQTVPQTTTPQRTTPPPSTGGGGGGSSGGGGGSSGGGGGGGDSVSGGGEG